MIGIFIAGEDLSIGDFVRNTTYCPDSADATRVYKCSRGDGSFMGVCLKAVKAGEKVSIQMDNKDIEPIRFMISNGNSLSNMGTSLFEDYIIIIAKYAVMTGFVLICLASFMAICSVRMCQ